MSSTQPSDYDWRTSYCPTRVVEYSENGLNFEPKYNSSDNCNTNSYLSVSSTSCPRSDQINDYSSNHDSNYIMEKLIESRNIILREQTLEELRGQGVEVKQNFNFDIYLCKVCDECFQTMESALDHTRSLEHFDHKSGKFADELDRSLVIPTEQLADINVVLARKQELKKLDVKTKYEFLRHGIRIKDGIGNDAFVCLECKVSFMSYNYVRHHLSKFKGYPELPASEAVYSSNTFQGPTASRAPSPWRQPPRPRVESPPRNGTQGSKTSRPSRRRRRRAENRKLNLQSNGESEAANPKRKRKRRNRNRNRNRSGRTESFKEPDIDDRPKEWPKH